MPGTTHYELTQQDVKALFDMDPEEGVLRWKTTIGYQAKQGQVAGYVSLGYRMIKVRQIRYQAHRLIWLWVTGDWPKNEVDHINGNSLDNRFSNLRDVPVRTNLENRQKPSSSSTTGVMGVFPYGTRYVSRITSNGVVHKVGVFETVEQASMAYQQAKRDLHAGYVS